MSRLSWPSAAVIERGSLLLVTGLGAWLRLATLGKDSLWFDEATTYLLVQGNWREILALNATENSAPPLYPLLPGLVTGPAATEAMLRAPSAIAGTAAIPLAWLLAREFVAARFALLAPLLVALAPTQVEFSQEVREYALTFCLACLVLLAYARFLKSPEPRRAAWIAAVTTLGICTQYGLVILAAGVNLVVLAAVWRREPRNPGLRLWLMSQIPVALVGLTLALTLLRTQLAHVAAGSSGYYYLADRYWDGTRDDLVTLLTGPRADIVGFAYPGTVVMALLVIGTSASLLRPDTRRMGAFLIVPAVVTLVAALGAVYPFGGVRQDMFLLPMIYVAAASGLAAATAWLAARLGPLSSGAIATLAVGILAWSGTSRTLTLVQSHGAEPLRPIVAELAKRVDPGERIYVYSGAVPAFRYYWRDQPDQWIAGSTHWSGLDRQLAARQMQDVFRELDDLMIEPAPFWMVISHILTADADEILAHLRERGAVNIVRLVNGVALVRVTPRLDRDAVRPGLPPAP
jgi:hypothetical protein